MHTKKCRKNYWVYKVEACGRSTLGLPIRKEIKSTFCACLETSLIPYIPPFNSYMLATDLHAQLDDLSGSLTQMIDAVNGLSISNKPNGESNDDPMTQISQVLSSHLESLQWIDGAVREVEGKVSDVEKRVKDSGYNLNGSPNQGKSRGFGLHR